MTAGDPSSSWRTLLMETLAPEGEPTLLASDGAPREWAGLPRMSGNRLLAEKIRSVVARVHESRTVVDVVVGPRRNQHVRVIGTPVIGPAETVHAVNLGVGDPDIEPPRPRPAAAFGWSAASRLISLGRELTDSEADPLIAGRLSLTAPEMFRHVVKLDAAVTLIAKALAPVPADRWAGTATIDTPMGDRAVHLAMRSMPAPDQQSWRGVLHDVTDTVAPQPPTLDAITLSAMAARGGKTAAALMDLTQGRLISWLTDPVPGIQWKGIIDNRDTPPPQDVDRILAAFEQLRNGTNHIQLDGIRLRRLDGGWCTVDARCTLISATATPLVTLVEMTPITTPQAPPRPA